jgi:hypothetical protein
MHQGTFTESQLASVFRADLLSGNPNAVVSAEFARTIMNMPRLSHPREWQQQSPPQPRLLVGFSSHPWASEIDQLLLLINADNFNAAVDWLDSNGYRMKFSQVPGGKQAAMKAAVKLRFPAAATTASPRIIPSFFDQSGGDWFA